MITIYNLLRTAKEYGGKPTDEQLAKAKESTATTESNMILKTINTNWQNGEYDEYIDEFVDDIIWELK